MLFRSLHPSPVTYLAALVAPLSRAPPRPPPPRPRKTLGVAGVGDDDRRRELHLRGWAPLRRLRGEPTPRLRPLRRRRRR